MLKEQYDNFSHSLKLKTNYKNFKYTHYLKNFNSILDYIIYDQEKFNLKNIVPLPSHEQVTEYEALPSKTMPSDHLALIYEFEINK